MKYMILGSDGLIGSALAAEGRRRGAEILGWDLHYGAQHDLRDEQNLQRLCAEMRTCDFVFFLAFDVGGAKYLSAFTREHVANNFLIMRNVYTALRTVGTPFLFASSQMSSMMSNPYGVCKLFGELEAQQCGGVITRLWNVYGPEDPGERSHVVTDFVHMALTEGTIRMRTTGEEQRQFLYVDDCAAYLLLFAERREEFDRNAYDVSSGTWTSIKEVAGVVSSCFPPGEVGIEVGDTLDSSQLVRNEPDLRLHRYFTPAISLREGVQQIVDQASGFHADACLS